MSTPTKTKYETQLQLFSDSFPDKSEFIKNVYIPHYLGHKITTEQTYGKHYHVDLPCSELNIQPIGFSGSGKSSFTKLLLSSLKCLHGDIDTAIEGDISRTTKETVGYRINKSVTLFDTVGTTDRDDFVKVFGASKGSLIQRLQSQNNVRKHCLILTVPLDIAPHNLEVLIKMKDQFTELAEYSSIFLLITKKDVSSVNTAESIASQLGFKENYGTIQCVTNNDATPDQVEQIQRECIEVFWKILNFIEKTHSKRALTQERLLKKAGTFISMDRLWMWGCFFFALMFAILKM